MQYMPGVASGGYYAFLYASGYVSMSAILACNSSANTGFQADYCLDGQYIFGSGLAFPLRPLCLLANGGSFTVENVSNNFTQITTCGPGGFTYGGSFGGCRMSASFFGV